MSDVDNDTITPVGRNVYAALGVPDAEGMQVKARLASQISDAIKSRRLSQAAAAEIIRMPPSKLGNLLKGQFRGVSEGKMMDCLALLGKEVQIVVRAAPRGEAGRVHVVERRPLSVDRA